MWPLPFAALIMRSNLNLLLFRWPKACESPDTICVARRSANVATRVELNGLWKVQVQVKSALLVDLWAAPWVDPSLHGESRELGSSKKYKQSKTMHCATMRKTRGGRHNSLNSFALQFSHWHRIGLFHSSIVANCFQMSRKKENNHNSTATVVSHIFSNSESNYIAFFGLHSLLHCKF